MSVRLLLLTLIVILTSACGGGGSSQTESPSPGGSSPVTVEEKKPRVWNITLADESVIIGAPLEFSFDYQDVGRCELHIEESVVPLFDREPGSGYFTYTFDRTRQSGADLRLNIQCYKGNEKVEAEASYSVLSKVFYSAIDTEIGRELWVTDELGNTRSIDINQQPGREFAEFVDFTVEGTKIYSVFSDRTRLDGSKTYTVWEMDILNNQPSLVFYTDNYAVRELIKADDGFYFVSYSSIDFDSFNALYCGDIWYFKKYPDLGTRRVDRNCYLNTHALHYLRELGGRAVVQTYDLGSAFTNPYPPHSIFNFVNHTAELEKVDAQSMPVEWDMFVTYRDYRDDEYLSEFYEYPNKYSRINKWPVEELFILTDGYSVQGRLFLRNTELFIAHNKHCTQEPCNQLWQPADQKFDYKELINFADIPQLQGKQLVNFFNAESRAFLVLDSGNQVNEVWELLDTSTEPKLEKVSELVGEIDHAFTKDDINFFWVYEPGMQHKSLFRFESEPGFELLHMENTAKGQLQSHHKLEDFQQVRTEETLWFYDYTGQVAFAISFSELSGAVTQSSNVSHLTRMDDSVLFWADSGVAEQAGIWLSNGTDEGTVFLTTSEYSPISQVEHNPAGQFVFTLRDTNTWPTTYNVILSDGTTEGTRRTSDLGLSDQSIVKSGALNDRLIVLDDNHNLWSLVSEANALELVAENVVYFYSVNNYLLYFIDKGDKAAEKDIVLFDTISNKSVNLDKEFTSDKGTPYFIFHAPLGRIKLRTEPKQQATLVKIPGQHGLALVPDTIKKNPTSIIGEYLCSNLSGWGEIPCDSAPLFHRVRPEYAITPLWRPNGLIKLPYDGYWNMQEQGAYLARLDDQNRVQVIHYSYQDSNEQVIYQSEDGIDDNLSMHSCSIVLSNIYCYFKQESATEDPNFNRLDPVSSFQLRHFRQNSENFIYQQRPQEHNSLASIYGGDYSKLDDPDIQVLNGVRGIFTNFTYDFGNRLSLVILDGEQAEEKLITEKQANPHSLVLID